MRLGFPLLAAFALTLSGCLASTSQPQVLDPAALVPLDLEAPLVVEHDHADPALHALATPNFQPLAHLSWDRILLDRLPAKQYGEIDVEGDVAFVAALMAGFAIVDISDPADLKTLSFTPIPPVYVADIKAAAGGDLAILGTQRSLGRLLGALGTPSIPAGVPIPSAAPIGAIGLQAWDTRDKANPQLVGYVYVDGGCHMVSILDIGGQEHVFCAPNDNSVRIFRIAHQGPAVVFEPVAVWAPGDLSEVVAYKAAPWRAQFTHDMTVQADPLTGEPVMFVSFWDLGTWVVDVKDPATPQTLGSWAGEDATLWGGRLHTSMAAMVGDQRVLITIPEYADIPVVFVLDATDYANLRLLGEWQPRADGDYGENPAIFSTHNFQVVGSKVYLAMYHGGVWVLDIQDPTRITPTAYFLPTGGEGATGGAGPADGLIPDTWDVVVANGHVFAVDIPTGLYSLHLAGDPGGDAAYDSFA